MATKMVTDRQKAADAVIAISDAQGAALVEGLNVLSRDSAFDAAQVQALLTGLRAALAGARERMVEGDALHERELADDPAARDARDHAVLQLREALVQLREVLTGLFSTQIADKILHGAMPSDPVVLARYAGESAAQLRSVALPTPRIAGAQVDAAALAADLEQRKTNLETQLSAVTREVREAQVTLDARNRALVDYDRIFSGVAAIYTGLFTLAGRDELAEKIRPSRSRPGRTEMQQPETALISTDEPSPKAP